MKVLPFSGSVNRKKIVKLDQAREPGHARLSGTETGNLFGELHPEAFLVFPSVSPTYLCAPPMFQCFFFASSSSLPLTPSPLSLSLLAFEEKWNLEAGPSSFRLDLNVGIFSGPFNRASFIFTFLPLSRNYSKYLKLVERFS